jgi:enoyl-CoA hydratase/carnithine racemase
MSDHIRIEFSDGILTVTLARPKKKNAITRAMYLMLAEATRRAQDDAAVRVLVFKAEGDSFSAGNDISDFAASEPRRSGQIADAPVFQFLKSLADLEKPAVAAVRGRAVGIGLTLLLHCDLVVVAEDALLSAPFVNLALAPEAASSLLLPMVIGHQRAYEMFAFGEPIDGRTAFAWGLANSVVPSAEVDAVTDGLAVRLAARAPNSIRKTKRLMRDAEKIWALMQSEGEAFRSQLSSPEAREAFAAFGQKRLPHYPRPG